MSDRADSPESDPVWIRQRHKVVATAVGVVEPLLAGEGFELVDLEYQPAGRTTLRVFVDRAGRERFEDPAAEQTPEGGVTIDEITGLTRLLSDALDVADPTSGGYQLEVSSPGVERALCRRGDFERAIGLPVQIRTGTKVEGRQRFRGTLQTVENERILVGVDGEEIAIPVTELVRARLDYFRKDSGKGRRRTGRKG